MSKHAVAWIEADRLIALTQTGFWSRGDFSAYERDLLAAVERAMGRPFDMLIDMTDHVPQAAEQVALHQELTVRVAARGLRHAAIVGASPLLSFQVSRGASAATKRFFASMPEGRQWLREAAM